MWNFAHDCTTRNNCHSQIALVNNNSNSNGRSAHHMQKLADGLHRQLGSEGAGISWGVGTEDLGRTWKPSIARCIESLCLINASQDMTEKTTTPVQSQVCTCTWLTHCFLSIGVIVPVPLLLSRRWSHVASGPGDLFLCILRGKPSRHPSSHGWSVSYIRSFWSRFVGIADILQLKAGCCGYPSGHLVVI